MSLLRSSQNEIISPSAESVELCYTRNPIHDLQSSHNRATNGKSILIRLSSLRTPLGSVMVRWSPRALTNDRGKERTVMSCWHFAMQMSQLLTNKPWIGKFSSVYNRPDSSWLAAGFGKVFCRHIFIDLLGFCALKNGAGKKSWSASVPDLSFSVEKFGWSKELPLYFTGKEKDTRLSPTTNSSELDNGLLATYAENDKEGSQKYEKEIPKKS